MFKFLNPLSYARAARRRVTLANQLGANPLHQGSKWSALRRFQRLEKARKLTGTYPIVPYVGGAVLAWPEGAGSVALQAKYGLGELNDQTFCLHALRSGDLFCDVGANAGVYTILASKAVGARTIAVEPVPKTFALLMQNVWANDVAHLVDARQSGIGNEVGTLNFTSNQWSLNHVVDEAGPDTVAVPVETLDGILAGEVPRIIKVDVEGFEKKLIEGGTKTLSSPNCAAVIMELSVILENFGSSRQEVFDMMVALGFKPCWYDPFSRKLTQPGTRGPRQFNVIFVRDEAFLADRIGSAPRFDVLGTRI